MLQLGSYGDRLLAVVLELIDVPNEGVLEDDSVEGEVDGYVGLDQQELFLLFPGHLDGLDRTFTA